MAAAVAVVVVVVVVVVVFGAKSLTGRARVCSSWHRFSDRFEGVCSRRKFSGLRFLELRFWGFPKP